MQPIDQPTDLASNVWKRFKRHRGAIGGMIILAILILLITFASLSPYDSEKSNLPEKFLPPSSSHFLGTDALGRDMLTRILYGGRISLAVGAIAVGISLLIGVPIGALAGYYGGNIDALLMRLTDAFLSLRIASREMLPKVTFPVMQFGPVLNLPNQV